MKYFFYQAMMPTVACLLVVASSNFAEAKPGFGGGGACANCHGGSVDGSLNVLPSDLLEITQGSTETLTFDLTNIPTGQGAIALTGLDDPLLGATHSGDWSIVGLLLGTDEPYESAPAPGSYTLGLTIDAGATVGDYAIGGQFAGGPAFAPASWNNAFDFTIRVVEIPEPASLALLCVGLTGITVMSRQGRRHRKHSRKE